MKKSAREKSQKARRENGGGAALPANASSDQSYKKIISILDKETGLELSRYKRGTIERRIERRMSLRKIKTQALYLRYLKKDRTETASLAEDILIHVTEFFRDPELFSVLAKKVFPILTKRRAPGRPVRIWVAGCSSGEEVYSIAIVLCEFMQRRGLSLPIQLFGTDISEKTLSRARVGRYDKRALTKISPERLKRFFVETEREDVLQISKTIRDMCIFAKHNLIADTPFSNIDLVSCRNVLIYLDETLQKKAVPIFHYALRDPGFLVLGTSESTAGYEELFSEVDKKHRVYEKRASSVRLQFSLAPQRHALNADPRQRRMTELDIEKEATKILVSKYTPSWVVVNDDLTIMQFRGSMHPFLEPAPGRATFNLLKMAKRELISALSESINLARKTRGTVRREHIPFRAGTAIEECRLEVVPLGGRGSDSYFLVLFSLEAKEPLKKPGVYLGQTVSKEKDQQIVRLQEELTNTTEYLQSLLEKQEVANEELRSANEEVTSTNEELHSMNEELETTQEELRSANEELMVVNAELETRNTELRETNELLKGAKETIEQEVERKRLILESIEDYAIFSLDTKGNIVTWNRAASKIKGYKEREVIGKNFAIFYTPEDRKSGRPQKLLEKARKEGRVEDTAWRVRKDGSRFFADVIITAMRDSGGKIIGFVKASRDLTAMKALEDEKQKAFHSLESQVEMRTKALKEEIGKRETLEQELRARAEMLAAADKQKDLFIATLSHELRNPLAPIVSAIELVKLQGNMPADCVELVNAIEHHTRQLMVLLNDLLDVSRIMRGKLQLTVRQTILDDVITHAMSAVHAHVESAGVRLTFSPAKVPITIHADAVRLEQIVTNLLDNAVKYSNAGGEIAIRRHTRKGFVDISVRDTGIGIPKDMLETIFDPFMQIDDGTRKKSGLGIGLMLSRNLARLHGGDLIAKSEGPGKGSEFILTLPLKAMRR